MENESLRKYELMLILSPNLSDAEIKSELSAIQKIIAESGGTIDQIDEWGIQEFSYKIKKEDKGYYVIFYFEITEPEKTKELEKNLNLQQDIFRYLLLKLDKNHVIRTLSEYEAQHAKEKKELLEKAEKKKEEQSRPPRKAPIMEKKPKEEVKEVPKEEKEPPAEVKEDAKPRKAKKEVSEDKEDKRPAVQSDIFEEQSEKEEKKPEAKEVKKDKEKEKEEEDNEKAKLDKLDRRLKELIDNPDIMDF